MNNVTFASVVTLASSVEKRSVRHRPFPCRTFALFFKLKQGGLPGFPDGLTHSFDVPPCAESAEFGRSEGLHCRFPSTWALTFS